MSRVAVALALAVTVRSVSADPRPPGLTLDRGRVNATLTAEHDVSAGHAGDPSSFAPDLSVGITDDVTLALVHSTAARTGFRGSAGAGICATDACAHTYDNAGLEVLYSLARGPFALAANAGVHASSFDRGHYITKLGAKLRYRAGRVVVAGAPSVWLAMTHRDDAIAPNRDRLWLPVTAATQVAGPVSAGVGTGFKTPLDDIGDSFEIAAGVFAQYTHSPQLLFGASWIHGRIAGGDAALPEGTSGLDFRALHLWISATR